MISIYDIFGPLEKMIDDLEGDLEPCQDNLNIATIEAKSVLKNKTLTEAQKKSLKTALTCIKNVSDGLEELVTEFNDDDDDEEFEIEVDE